MPGHRQRRRPSRPLRRVFELGVRSPAWVEALEARCLLTQIFRVTTTADSEAAGTLRWAIHQVNNDATDAVASPDRIEFAIPQSDPGYSNGAWTISVLNLAPDAWPKVENPATIDGYTQQGAQPNTNGPGMGDNAVLTIQLDGSKYVANPEVEGGGSINGLTLDGAGSTVEGLAIGGFGDTEIKRAPENSPADFQGGLGVHDGFQTFRINVNGGAGVVLAGAGSSVTGSFLGVDASGLSPAPNSFAGVYATGAGVAIGGVTPAARNVIAGNTSPAANEDAATGVFIVGGTGDTVQGNLIGTDRTGLKALGNDQGLALLRSADGNLIGGTQPGAGNVIAGSLGRVPLPGVVARDASGVGLAISQGQLVGPTPTTRLNVVQGNLIGVGVDGTTALPNTGTGIDLSGAIDNTIGGAEAGAGNLIGANGGDGIAIEDRLTLAPGGGLSLAPFTLDGLIPSSGNVIQGNHIGTDAASALDLGNGGDGIVINSSGGETLGGPDPGDRNVIAFNAGGVVVNKVDYFVTFSGPETFPIAPARVSRNSIYANGDDRPVNHHTIGGLGIDGDATADVVSIGSVTSAGGSTVVLGTLVGTPNTPYTVEFFQTPPAVSGLGEGQTYLATVTVTTDANGKATLDATNATLPVTVATGQYVSATATDPEGHTSRFSRTSPILALSQPAPPATLAPGDTFTITDTLTNTGSATNVNINGATGVVLKNALPPGFTVMSMSAGAYDAASRTFTAMLGTIANGGSATVSITLRADKVGTFGDQATVVADQPASHAYASDLFTVANVRPKAQTTTTLSADVDPAEANQPVTFTAVVAKQARAGDPTGDVIFTVDGVNQYVALGVVNGVDEATLTTTIATAGNHAVGASYQGDAAFLASAATGLTEVIAGVMAPPVVPVFPRFVVTNTNDSGPGSLRQAIMDSEVAGSTTAVPNHITFAIPATDPGKDAATGAFLIKPTSALPAIRTPTVLDGYTQPGSSPNTNPIDRADNAAIRVVLDGTNAGFVDGLDVYADSSAVRGLAVDHFRGQFQRTDLTVLGGVGLHLFGANDLVAGDFVGVDAGGIAGAGNDLAGVELTGANAAVGGVSAADRDVISGNGGANVLVDSASAQAVIVGNFIGTDATGAKAVSPADANPVTAGFQSGLGVLLAGTSNRVGGPTAAERNVISGNVTDGVTLEFQGLPHPSQNRIVGNFIGTDLTGTAAVPNRGSGVSTGAAVGNTIGGTTPGERNLISGNGTGVSILPIEAPLGALQANVVEGNFIGTDVTGTRAIAGQTTGVIVADFGSNVAPPPGDGIPGQTVGGLAPGDANLISGNSLFGIQASSANNQILGNQIGLSIDGDPLGNGVFGIWMVTYNDPGVKSPDNNTFQGNTIAYNAGQGVAVGGQGNQFTQNSFFGNAGLGIDLGLAAPTQVPFPANLSTPNHGQNAPSLTSATVTNGSTAVLGSLMALPNRQYTLEFFANDQLNPAGDAEGQTYLGSQTYLTDSNGLAPVSDTFAADLSGEYLTATASTPNPDAGGTGIDTSEFSAPAFVPGRPSASPPADLAVSATVLTASPSAGQPIAYQFTVTNMGSGTATDATINVMLPEGASGVTTTAGAQVGNAVVADLGTLLSGKSRTITVTLSDGTIGRVTAAGAVTANEIDPTLTNNRAEASAITANLLGTTTVALDATPGLLTATVAPTAAGAPTPTGSVTFDAGGAALGTSPVGADGRATFSTAGLAPGTYLVTATYLGDANFGGSQSSPATVIISPAVVTPPPPPPPPPTPTPIPNPTPIPIPTPIPSPATEGPRVLGVDRFGYHLLPTTLVVRFDGPLSLAPAQNPRNYQISGPGGAISVRSAVYDAATNSVTLTPAERLNVHRRYRLRVVGTGIGGVSGASGLLLDGQGQGTPGGDYVATIDAANLVVANIHLPGAGQALRLSARARAAGVVHHRASASMPVRKAKA